MPKYWMISDRNAAAIFVQTGVSYDNKVLNNLRSDLKN
jgi:hypothetical protein